MKRATTIEVKGGPGEAPLSVLRKFSRRVNESGILRSVRGRRFFKRLPSGYTKKMSALSRIEKRAERAKLFKLGKLKEEPRRGARPTSTSAK